MTEKEEKRVSSFEDKLDVIKFVSDIQLRIKKDITSDFVLAKLDDKRKEDIADLVADAFFAKRLLYILAEKSTRPKWSKKKEEWIEVNISKEESDYIRKIGDALFDSYMVRLNMTVILNRNVDKNYLVNVLSGYNQQEDLIDEEASGRIMDLLKPKKEEKKKDEK